MSSNDYIAVALPVVTDDDGECGFLWKGFVHTFKVLNPVYEAKSVCYTKKQAETIAIKEFKKQQKGEQK